MSRGFESRWGLTRLNAVPGPVSAARRADRVSQERRAKRSGTATPARPRVSSGCDERDGNSRAQAKEREAQPRSLPRAAEARRAAGKPARLLMDSPRERGRKGTARCARPFDDDKENDHVRAQVSGEEGRARPAVPQGRLRRACCTRASTSSSTRCAACRSRCSRSPSRCSSTASRSTSRRRRPSSPCASSTSIEIGATEVGLRIENGVLAEVLAPNTRRLYWKGYIDVRVEKVDIATDFADRPEARAAARRGYARAKVAGAAENVLAVLVPQYHVVVLYVDGKVERLLEAGLHAFWKFEPRPARRARGPASAGARGRGPGDPDQGQGDACA